MPPADTCRRARSSRRCSTGMFLWPSTTPGRVSTSTSRRASRWICAKLRICACANLMSSITCLGSCADAILDLALAHAEVFRRPVVELLRQFAHGLRRRAFRCRRGCPSTVLRTLAMSAASCSAEMPVLQKNSHDPALPGDVTVVGSRARCGCSGPARESRYCARRASSSVKPAGYSQASKEGKFDVRPAPGDQVGGRLTGTAGQGPAEGPVTGIEEQVADSGCARSGAHCWAWPGAALPIWKRRQSRPPPENAARTRSSDRSAARLVQRCVVAGKFRGTGGAQAVAQPGHRDLGAFVASGTRWAPRPACGSGDRDRIALDRIDRNARFPAAPAGRGCSCRARRARHPRSPVRAGLPHRERRRH